MALSDNELEKRTVELLEALVCEDCQAEFKKISAQDGVTLAETMALSIRVHIGVDHTYHTLRAAGFIFPGDEEFHEEFREEKPKLH